MFKKILLLSVLTLSAPSFVFAGDTVIITAPGGATQTAASAAVATTLRFTPSTLSTALSVDDRFVVQFSNGSALETRSKFIANIFSVYAN